MVKEKKGFDVEPKLWSMVKVYCAKKGMTISDFMENLILNFFDTKNATS